MKTVAGGGVTVRGGATLVYLVRHGRTTLNAEGRFRGRLDPPLDAVGWREAEAAGRRLQAASPIRVFSSPLRRAAETAEALARATGAPMELWEDLVDVDYGAWEGLTADEARDRDPAAFACYVGDPERAIPPGGEPLSQVADRMVKGLLRMGEEYPGRTLAAVSHDVPMRLVVARIAGLAGSAPWDLLVPTGSVICVAVVGGHLELPRPRPVLVQGRWRDVRPALEEGRIGDVGR
jgi:broad specificity phosphatase PhoE